MSGCASCFSFLGGSGSSAAPAGEKANESKTSLLSRLPSPFSTGPDVKKVSGKVSGKVRLRPDQKADPQVVLLRQILMCLDTERSVVKNQT